VNSIEALAIAIDALQDLDPADDAARNNVESAIETLAALRELIKDRVNEPPDDGFEQAREFDRTHPGWWGGSA
jgi:hypothetical protein